jgi:hypothetical protein
MPALMYAMVLRERRLPANPLRHLTMTWCPMDVRDLRDLGRGQVTPS